MTSRKPPHGPWPLPRGPSPWVCWVGPTGSLHQVFVLSQAWGWSPAFVGQGGEPSLPGPRVNSQSTGGTKVWLWTWGQTLSKGWAEA